MLLKTGSPDIQLYFQHGWSFGSQCWQGWLEFVEGCHPVYFDRGYWGNYVAMEVLQSANPVVMVVHSLGLHFIQEISLEFVDLLVIIGGFRNFHGEGPQDERFSRRHLQRMHKRLTEAPLSLVRDFYRDCSYPKNIPCAKKSNMGLLADDLLMLDTHVLDVDIFNTIPNIIVLHGENDRIVPVERAIQLDSFLPASTLDIVPGAGHGLPFTHPQYCVEMIARSVEKIDCSL